MKLLLLLLVVPACLADVRPIRRDGVQRLMTSINARTRALGGVYANYSCKTVSWDDGDRGTTADGALSVWGASITDTRLWAKDGRLLFTLRGDNWDEKLGRVSARDVRLVVGNTEPGRAGKLRSASLWDLLEKTGQYGAYAGLPRDTSLLNETLDDQVSIRFQTTFLPIGEGPRATLEFATEAYNYNTHNDSDPKNLVVLATSGGIAVQQDGKGAKKLFHHAVDGARVVHRHWLEAERSNYSVGGAQNETEADRQDALQRGKDVARAIGISAMGKRFNVLMTVQVPLEQEERGYQGGYQIMFGSGGPQYRSRSMGRRPKPVPADGVANAARVSIGSEVDTWDGLTVKRPRRHPTQHATVTVVLYNTIAGGVPRVEDLKAAIDDMEALYDACDWRGNLADKEAGFMKTQLTNDTLGGIWHKITQQPYQPDVQGTAVPA